MYFLNNHITNIADSLIGCYIWSKRRIIKAFIKNAFLYFQVIVSSVIVMVMIRRCSEKTQLIIMTIVIIVIAVAMAENKYKYLNKNNVAL
jgi:hypothetical protein